MWGPPAARVYVNVHGFSYHGRQRGYVGSGQPPESRLVSESHAAPGTMPIWVARAATWVGPYGCPGPRYSVGGHIWVHDPSTVRVCVDVPGLCCHQSLHRGSGLGCHLWPCWCPRVVLSLRPCQSEWPELSPGAKILTNLELLLMVMSGSPALQQPGPKLMFMAPVTTNGHADAQSWGSHLRWFWCMRVMLQPEPCLPGPPALKPGAMLKKCWRGWKDGGTQWFFFVGLLCFVLN